MTLSGQVAGLCAALAPLLSCVSSRWESCEGIPLACPEGSVCDLAYARCSEPACLNRADGEACERDGRAGGVCAGGTCGLAPAPRCGDGWINQRGEQCDGSELNDQTCHRLGFYDDTAALRCDADCRFDTSGCTGTCGDGVTSEEEWCDPTDPAVFLGFCAASGHSAGLLGCRAQCDGEATDGCVDFGWAGTELRFSRSPYWAELTDVWGAEGQIVVAATSGELRWFDGATWRDDLGGYPTGAGLPAEESPRAIWGASPRDLWIASASGLAHWNGTAWSLTDYPNRITRLWGSAGDDIVGVDESGAIHHYDGARWSQMVNRGAGALRDVSGSGPADIYALADEFLVHYDGQRWSPAELRPTGTFADVWAQAPDDVWATSWEPTGYSDGVVTGTAQIHHYDGSRWGLVLSFDESAPALVAGRAKNDVWVAHGGEVLHFDGAGWTGVAGSGFAPTSYDTRSIQALWVDRASVVIAGGGLVEARMRHRVAVWAGAGQLVSPAGMPDVSWSGVWGEDSSRWIAVGQLGPESTTGIAYVAPRAGATVGETFTFPERLWGVAGFAPDDVFAVDARASVHHFDGQAWTVVRQSDELPSYQWGPPVLLALGARDVVALVRTSRYTTTTPHVARFDGSRWSDVLLDQTLCIEPWAMTGSSPEDLWFSCGFPRNFEFIGNLAHFDGTTTTLWPGPTGVQALWASGPNDVYALEPPRNVWHFDGVSWTVAEVGLASSRFDQIRGRAADDIFVLGPTGDIAHFDGRMWMPLASLTSRSPSGLFQDMAVLPGILLTVDGGLGPTSGVNGLLRTRLWTCRACERDTGNRIDDDCDGRVDESDAACDRWDPATPGLSRGVLP